MIHLRLPAGGVKVVVYAFAGLRRLVLASNEWDLPATMKFPNDPATWEFECVVDSWDLFHSPCSPEEIRFSQSGFKSHDVLLRRAAEFPAQFLGKFVKKG